MMAVPHIKAIKGRRVTYYSICGLLCLGLAMGSLAAHAETTITDREWISIYLVAESELDKMRGRFRTSAGLEITLGLEKLTIINGHINEYGSVNFQDSNSSVAVTPRPAIPESTFPHFSLIQNNLDNQLIQNISIMNIHVANLFSLHSQVSAWRRIAESADELYR